MGLSNELSCETVSFFHSRNTHRFFQSEGLRLYFPKLEPWVAWSVSLPSCSFHLSACNCGTAYSASRCLPWSSSLCLPGVFSTWLPVSTPPAVLDECFFFNFWVVRLPYSSIFWLFWLFLVFKLVFVLLLVVREGTVCLPMPPSWPEVGSLPS